MTKIAATAAFAALAAAALAPAAANATYYGHGTAYTYTGGQLAGTGEATDHAALTGATVIDFASAATGTYTSLTQGDVTFTALNGDFNITDSYGGYYNTTGRHLADDYANNASAIRFDFAADVSAFGFNFGASDAVWELAAFDADGVELERFELEPTKASNAGEWFGIASVGISWATLSVVDGCWDDYVMIDDFAYVGWTGGGGSIEASDVPVPAAAPLLAAGLGLIGFMKRRRG